MKKKITIIILALLIIGGIIFGVVKTKQNSNEKIKQAETELITLKEKEIQLQLQENEIFFEEGFSEEYYKTKNELETVREQIRENENIIDGFGDGDSMFGIMQILFFVIFGLAFFFIFTTIIVTIYRTIKGHNNITPNITINDQTTDQMEKMATMLGKVAIDMAKEMNPEYKSLKCPNCGANLTDDVDKCEYCDAPLTKVVATKK